MDGEQEEKPLSREEQLELDQLAEELLKKLDNFEDDESIDLSSLFAPGGSSP
jgi:hypothetical protein